MMPVENELVMEITRAADKTMAAAQEWKRRALAAEARVGELEASIASERNGARDMEGQRNSARAGAEKWEARVEVLRKGAVHSHVEWNGSIYPMTCGCCGGRAEKSEDIIHNDDCPVPDQSGKVES